MIKHHFFAYLMTIFLFGPSAIAQDTLNFPTLGEVIRIDSQIDTLLEQDAQLEVIASGFGWVEGPVWIPGKPGHLLFSEIPSNTIYRWDEGQGISKFMHPSGYTGVADYGGEPGSNGLTLDSKGRLVLCEHGDRRISVLTKSGGKRTLVDNYSGLRLNSPNDLIFHSNGDLYFTDPPYGLPKRFDDPLRELDFCGVYCLRKSGELILLTDQMSRPNGIGLSPDEKTLYVAQSDGEAAYFMSYPVLDDGIIGQGTVFYDATPQFGKLPGAPDGMAVAADGTIWATGPGGVHVFSSDQKLLGRISTGERTSNCTFGGAENNILYITADMYVCRIETKTKGLTR